jgi:hypothetical protein
LELGTWNLELGTWNLELGTWHLKPVLWPDEARREELLLIDLFV